MPKYDLTPNQRELLRTLVAAAKEGRLDQPIIPVGSKNAPPIVLGNPEITFRSIAEFDALNEAGLLGLANSSKGNPNYSLRQSAFDAVEDDFEIPEHMLPSRSAIGAVIGNMSGGNVQAIAQAIDSQISQNVNDPQALRAAIDELGAALVDAVRSELQANDLTRYVQEVEELKAALAAESPEPSMLKRILGTLSFFGDVEGTIGLALRVWPLIQVGLALAQQLS